MFYILKRILLALLTIWVVITITFFVMHAVPGGPFMSEKAISEAAQAALEAKYGLDKPLGVQYATYLKDILTKFDFGPSLKQRGRDVIVVIADGMKTSVKLGLCAAFGAAIIGVVLGAIAALRRNKFIDKVIMVITTAFVSMPSFIMGSFLLIVFSVKLNLLPANGSTAEGLILPIITLGLYPMAYITRLTRSSMLDVLGQDYIRTAKAKGVFRREDHLRPCAEELPDPGPHLFRTHACLHRHRFHGRRTDLCRAWHRPPIRFQHPEPRLHHDHGHHHRAGLPDRHPEPDHRYPVQGRRSPHRL